MDVAARARRLYAGARQALGLRQGQRAVLFDVGGHATTAILGDEHEAHLATSLKLGVLRLRDHWLPAASTSPRSAALLAEWVETVTASTFACFRAAGFELVAMTSGTALALARVAGRRLPRVAGVDRYALTLDDLSRWQARFCAGDRAMCPELDRGGHDTLLSGAVIARSLLAAAGAPQTVVCDAGVREGRCADHLAGRSFGAPPAVTARAPAPLIATSST